MRRRNGHVGLSFTPVIPGLVAPRPEQIPLPVALPDQGPPPDTAARYRAWLEQLHGSTGAGTQALIDGIGPRWAAALRRYGPALHTAKKLAALISETGVAVDHRTVEGWLQGRVPAVRYLAAAAALWGAPLVAEVLGMKPGGDRARAARFNALISELAGLAGPP